eukprot:CAMPEP_0181313172 /NCGR_PEP_ID=MMETSP1101-20121128/14106_1 /TAXON_ID=46948 /ORGANISM="Rhodomonas abbreviata, Strain Caron Lab Isolate" /LENGTH=65 /DNA_ID=CAMNT_0023420107 /DNA_START=197 /DNA_END=395 /DNA_ORIENTATION=+
MTWTLPVTVVSAPPGIPALTPTPRLRIHGGEEAHLGDEGGCDEDEEREGDVGQQVEEEKEIPERE